MDNSPPSILKLSAASFLRRIEPLPAGERAALLRARCEVDPELFAAMALAEHCRLPFAPFHRELFAWHLSMGGGDIAARRGRRHVLAAPRGSAKSTIVSLALALHDILYRREPYILLLSATARQAAQRLRAIRRELEQGPAGRLFGAAKAAHYSAHVLVHGDIRIEAHGAGCELRGLNSNGFRPTKIILDDAEASRAAASQRAREKLLEWFAEIVEYLGDVYTNILAIGTVLHDKGLIATLLRRPDFQGRIVRSIESFSPREDLWGEWRRLLLDFSHPRRREAARDYFLQHREDMEAGTRVLWRDKEDYEELMAQLTLQGRRAFYQEKQNTPLGPEDALFDAEAALRVQVQCDDLLVVTVSATGGVPVIVRRYPAYRQCVRTFGYLDAAMGKGAARGEGDFAALAVVDLMPDRSLALQHLAARRIAPTAQVAALFDRHELHPFEVLAIEGTGFQELLVPLIEEERGRRRRDGRRFDLPATVVTPRRSKAARISALEPLLTNGTLALAPGLDEEFWEELSTWPRCRHDDALDAAAGAVELALSAYVPEDGIPGLQPGRNARGHLKGY